jgi:tetratricopeptide (TPR) repeat protein
MDAPMCPTCSSVALVVQTATAHLDGIPTIDLTFRCEQDHSWMVDKLGLTDATETARAVNRQHVWRGETHAVLGLLLEVAGRADDAYEEYGTAFRCDDVFDRGFCHERRAAYEAQHGWLRNALRSFREALAADRRASGARVAAYAQAVEAVERELTTRGIPFPPADRNERDKRWLRACELEIPPEFGARNEYGQPLADAVIEIERRIRAERWDDAVAALQALRADPNNFIDAIGFASHGAELARQAGQREVAIELQRLVVEAYVIYASGASSGAEGMGRMADVERERARLREWEAAAR